MSGIIAGAGVSLPSRYQALQWNIPTATLAAGTNATGGIAIANSVKTFSLNPLVASNDYSKGDVSLSYIGATSAVGIGFVTTYKITTDTTDTVSLDYQYSLDGGTTYTDKATLSTVTAHKQNLVITDFSSDTANIVTAGSAPTNNQLLLRLAFYDVTNPTTDVLTITNLQINALLWVFK